MQVVVVLTHTHHTTEKEKEKGGDLTGYPKTDGQQRQGWHIIDVTGFADIADIADMADSLTRCQSRYPREHPFQGSPSSTSWEFQSHS